MGILGSGLGLVMQVLVIAVQNAVDYRDLGVATSGAILFRLIGGALGTAIFGAIFASQLAVHLRTVDNIALPEGAGVGPRVIAQLEPAARAIYIDAFTQSLSLVFLVAAGIGAIGFLLTWLIPEMPLRESIAAVAEDVGRETGDLFPMPTDESSVERLERSLSLIASRETRRAYVRQVVERAGIDLGPLASWLLVRPDQNARPTSSDSPDSTTSPRQLPSKRDRGEVGGRRKAKRRPRFSLHHPCVSRARSPRNLRLSL